jgi:hypothetical protein
VQALLNQQGQERAQAEVTTERPTITTVSLVNPRQSLAGGVAPAPAAERCSWAQGEIPAGARGDGA